MAGHSKFKNIMHRKGAQDAKRAKIFTKVGREITVAARMGGPDPEMNARLRSAVIAARAVNMPNDRIKRAIDSGSGAGDNANYEEMRYEGYGAGGVAVIVEALTDNRNRTASEMRTCFGKYGGNLGETNSVSFMFQQIGEISYPVKAASADAMFDAAVEAGAQNAESSEDGHIITTDPKDLAAVRDALDAKFGPAERAAIIWTPLTTAVVDEEKAQQVMKLVEMLEDNDDVQTVTTNLEVSDEIMERLLAS